MWTLKFDVGFVTRNNPIACCEKILTFFYQKSIAVDGNHNADIFYSTEYGMLLGLQLQCGLREADWPLIRVFSVRRKRPGGIHKPFRINLTGLDYRLGALRWGSLGGLDGTIQRWNSPISRPSDTNHYGYGFIKNFCVYLSSELRGRKKVNPNQIPEISH